jgi:hypothetical protein
MTIKPPYGAAAVDVKKPTAWRLSSQGGVFRGNPPRGSEGG